MTLQDTVRYFTEETEILPCLSVTCGGAGLCVHARGGVINEQGTPVSDRTLFDLASLTKLFTGLLTMRLWEEGKLDLTRPVTDYAPQYRYLSDMPVEKVLGFEIGLTTPERIDTQKTPEAAKQQLWAVQPGEIRGRAYSDIHAMVIRDVIEGAAQSEYGAELTQKKNELIANVIMGKLTYEQAMEQFESEGYAAQSQEIVDSLNALLNK